MTPPPSVRDRGLVDDAIFVVIAFAFSWCFLLLLDSSRTTMTIATFGPTVAALALAAKHNGGRGVLTQLKRFISFRAPVLAYLLAWYLLPLVYFGVFKAFGFTTVGADDWTAFQTIVLFAPLNYTIGILVFATVGPHGEELGWRGYLLPRWRERFGEATSPLLVGLVWTAWHLPLFLNPAWVSAGVSFGFNIATYTITVVAISYAISFVSWISKNNLIVCILMHGVLNLSHTMLGGYEGTMHDDPKSDAIVLLIAAVGAAVIAGVLWQVIKRRRATAATATARPAVM